MESRIQVTPVYSLLIRTNGDVSTIFIVSGKNNEIRELFTELTFENIQDWNNRELEAHVDALTYAAKTILEERKLGEKLLSGKYIPGSEYAGYDVICA
jgi:hypothetical protein